MNGSAEMRQFCTFYLESELFGIEVLKVQEECCERRLDLGMHLRL